ncbi:hypothetical protein EF914_15270 [Streptomyces sp. WAC05458]|nr:hypothetical protein EF914_15270 [Streptomyces sp. WAC05458]
MPGARVEGRSGDARPGRLRAARGPKSPPAPGDWTGGGRRAEGGGGCRGGVTGRRSTGARGRAPGGGGRAPGGDRSERCHRTVRRNRVMTDSPSGKTPRSGTRSPPRGVRPGSALILREARQSVRGHDARWPPDA